MPKLYGAVEELQRLLTVFAANFGMPEMGTVERSKWNQSVLSLGQQAGQAVAGQLPLLLVASRPLPRQSVEALRTGFSKCAGHRKPQKG